MNPGQIAGFILIVGVWFFLLCVFVIPVVMNVWRRREQADKKATEKILKATKFDRSGAHIQDVV